MDINARNYPKVMTYNLTGRLEVESFHDYKFIWFSRELEKVTYSSSKHQHMNA
jgi:hypothetical protein